MLKIALLLIACAGVYRAWGQQPSTGDDPPQTRAGEIERERQAKAAELAPEDPTPIERVLERIKRGKALERVTSGVAGIRVHLGGLITGSGLAAGPEYYRRDLLRERVRFRASARGSLRKFYLLDMEMNAPKLADGALFFNLRAVHRNYPSIDYYGPGPGSAKSSRTAFLLEDTSLGGDGGVHLTDRLSIGATGRYYMANVGPGRDDAFASADRVFTERVTPGIQMQSDFAVGGGFVQYDWRDNPGGPRRGGNYGAHFESYSDIRRGQFSFSRLEIEAQQYVPFFNERRVIALRARADVTDPHGGQRVPFYLQPTLGGSDDLRGFRPFRFYDNGSVAFNAEYRWDVFSGLDMALFGDAGRVFHDWRRIGLNHLEGDAGFGFRFNVRNDVFLRLDTGFSREGFQVWVKFGNVF